MLDYTKLFEDKKLFFSIRPAGHVIMVVVVVVVVAVVVVVTTSFRRP